MTSFLIWAGSSAGLAIVIGVVVVIAWSVIRLLGLQRARSIPDLLVALSVATILVFTMRPGNAAAITTAWQLLPFADLLLAIPAGGVWIRLALADLVGNVLLFMPLGGAFALRWPDATGLRVVVVAALTSTAIELVQGLTGLGRMAQTNDVLMNVLGAGLGWWTIRRAFPRVVGSRLSAAVPRRR